MACLQKLKEDLKVLQSLFPKTHERLQVVSCTVDEVNFIFVGPNGEKMPIVANIIVSRSHFNHLFVSCISNIASSSSGKLPRSATSLV